MKISTKLSFGAFCRDILGEPISPAWIAAYKAFEGKPMTDAELEIWRALSGQQDYAPQERNELWAVKGRRSAGTKTACKFLTYLIHTHGAEYRKCAAKSDRLHALIVLQTRDVAREVMSYFASFYNDTILKSQVSEIFKTSIELANGFVISIGTCSYRAPRGISIPMVLLDETGAWRTEGTDLDVEVYKSVRPAMIQFRNSKLIGLGSPWIKNGLLYDCWQRRFDRSDRLVLHCPTPAMNPLISREELGREEANDPSNYRREFLAEWSDDVDSFLPDSDILAAIRGTVRERAPVEIYKNSYIAALDASGLSGRDRFTLAVGHRIARGSAANTCLDFDALRGWSREPVSQVVDEVASLLKSYGLRSVIGDQFGASFLKELLSQRGIEMRCVPFTSRSKPEILLALKLALAQGKVSLLDHPESLRELRMLESKRTSGGNYTIAAPRGQHDDFAIVIALLAHEAKEDSSGFACLVSNGVSIAAAGQPVGPPSINDPRFWPKRRGSLVQ